MVINRRTAHVAPPLILIFVSVNIKLFFWEARPWVTPRLSNVCDIPCYSATSSSSRVPVTPSVSHKSEYWQQTQDTGSHWSQHTCANTYLCRSLYHYLMDVFPSQENVNLEVCFHTFYGFHIVLSTPVSPWYTEAPSVDNKAMMAPRRINHPEPGHLLAGPFPAIILKTWESPGAIIQQHISTVNKRKQQKVGRKHS